MVLKLRLDQRQVQKLILAPALQQAIKLLPLTNLDLIEVIDVELSQNPMLEEETPERDVEAGPSRKNEEERERIQVPDADVNSGEAQGDLKQAADTEYDLSFQEYFDGQYRPAFSDKKDIPSLENTLSKSPTLWDHLNWQAALTFFDPEDQEIAQLIIGSIDEDGYLSTPAEEIAQMAGVPAEKINAVREKIKTFDPVGVGALNLKEALLAQMDDLHIMDEITRKIVSEHLHFLEKSDYVQLARLLGLSLPAVKAHIEVIKGLDPAPGRKYAQEKTTYVVPDILVSKEGEEFKITLNNEGLPRLRLNAYYKRLLAKAAGENTEAYAYLKDKMKKALWFLRSLNQRDLTVYNVAKYIVDKQRDFLDKGIDYIKPLTLLEISQEIGVHESTVGRVVANKHMTTPRGVFSLKYFFHKSLVGDYGEEVSSLRIKDKIKKLIESEDRDNPLSDIEIGELLAKGNLRIARRTVAKYRKQLKIPPSHIRKRKFVMEGQA